MNRRNFLRDLTGGVIAGTIALNSTALIANEAVSYSEKIQKIPNNIKPKALKKGSKIAITAPASTTNMWEIQNCLRFCKANGLEVEIGDTIKKQNNNYQYFSAPDDVRLNEFNKFLNRDDIDAIICGRGGYGIMRILSKIDYNAIISKPKIIMGFSDITALLIAIHKYTKLVTFHGPVASSSFNQIQTDNLKKALFTTKQNLTYNESMAVTFAGGISKGKLIGGNLSLLTSTLGTEFEIDTTDSILFFEDVSVHSYQIDRMLTQLQLANKLQKCKGIIIGEFKDLNSRKPFYPNRGFSLKEVFTQLLKPLNIPIVIGFNFGHLNTNLTLPIGVEVILDADKKSLTATEQTVV